MVRFRLFAGLLCVAVALFGVPLEADETNAGQAKLDKATEIKITAETAADLNDVIKLCGEALEAGLDEANASFANELLSSTLTQRADLICSELFEQPLRPGRARRLVEMALRDLQQTLAINDKQPLALYLIGRLYGHLGEREKAFDVIESAIELSGDDPPTQAQALLVRANLQDDAEKRRADFDRAVALTPGDPSVYQYRGMSHLSENRPQEALADFQAAIDIDDGDGDTYEALGLAQSLLQKYDDAMESFDKAIELSPSATAYMHRSRLRAIKGEVDAAIEDVEHSLEMQPGSIQALQLHAALLGSTGRFEEALRDLNLLRTAMPDNPELLLQIATLHQAARQPDKAVSAYDALLAVDEKNVDGFRGRADAHLGLGQQAEAIDDYKQALEHDPDNSGVLNNLAWVLATSTKPELRDGRRALELAKRACEVTEYKEAHVLSTLAASYAESGDFDAAIEWSKKAVDLGAEALKSQLRKELESYEARKPWREEVPPDLAAGPQAAAGPPEAETAGSKARR